MLDFSTNQAIVPHGRRNPYYIVSLPYERTSAGIRTLHLLCHWLNRAGFPAFICNYWGETGLLANTDLITPILTPHAAFEHRFHGLTPIVVYPEVVSGNPLRAQCVARYVLNFPGKMGGDAQFSEHEMIFTYSQRLADAVGQASGVLCMPVIDMSVFRLSDETQAPRTGSCFYANKFRRAGGKPFGLPEGAVEILNETPDAQTPEQIAELFRRSEKFYAFEDTALILEAGLCGCPTVMMRNEYFTSPLGVLEFGTAGLAFEDNEAELVRARETIPQVKENYAAIVERFWRQFEIFIQITQQRAAELPSSEVVIEGPTPAAAQLAPEAQEKAADASQLDPAARKMMIAGLRNLSFNFRLKYYLGIFSERRRKRFNQKWRAANDLIKIMHRQSESET